MRIEGILGVDRAMMYVLSAWTGYRRKELASLTSKSFDLAAELPTVTVQAAHTKNKRADIQPLHSGVVTRLREWFASKGRLEASTELFPQLQDLHP